ncbi:hypothetical protein TOPH_01933 [Tolypocladium ophioglossoides CBS 100239]|uniref:Uncharacterized protein n=1 Tax=Tolypocladium ophioglossoides (strain CBS 100239) TaxID=1163406 RepID=A0A0L0NIB0_TOLOC|nr:hypothetical protein TOPH_01933 [Tolypocladium ophioglossoides CBS 100239]
MSTTGGEMVALNWATTDIKQEKSLQPVNWEALVQYAIDIKRRREGNNGLITCHLSFEYNKGGRNVVRRLDFQDGTRWSRLNAWYTKSIQWLWFESGPKSRARSIGNIVKCRDGTYSMGPLPGIGGPFDSAAHFFEAWADKAEFPYREELIRERTPLE